MKKKKTDFEELMKNVDYTRWLQALIPVMQPIIIFGAWLGFSMIDKKASAVSKIIALAEPIPTINLNVPRPVVLASLYHSTDVALKILNDVIDYFKDLDIPSADDIIEDIEEEIKEGLGPEAVGFLEALSDCNENAQKSLGFTYPILGPLWIVSCMAQKGFSVSSDYVKDYIKDKATEKYF